MEFFRRNGTGLALIMATLLAAGCTGKFNEDDDDNVVAINDSTGPVVKIIFPPASSLTDSTAVVAVDLSTGNRTIVSDPFTGYGNYFRSPKGIRYSSTLGYALVVDSSQDALFGLELTTGERVILSK